MTNTATGIVYNWPKTDNKVYYWARQYVRRYTDLGAGPATGYLRRYVPSQVQPQVLSMADRALEKLNHNNKRSR